MKKVLVLAMLVLGLLFVVTMVASAVQISAGDIWKHNKVDATITIKTIHGEDVDLGIRIDGGAEHDMTKNKTEVESWLLEFHEVSVLPDDELR